MSETNTIGAEQPGLRERKKQATYRSIKRAAVRLAREHGLEHLTVDAISEAAEVSPRTFFNYFSSKEDALIGENFEAGSEVHDAILARPPGESPLQMLRGAVADSQVLRTADERREETVARQRLVRENPELLPRQLAKYAAFERSVAAALAERLDLDPDDDPWPGLLAAIAVSVVRVAAQGWTEDPSRTLAEWIDDGFDLLETRL